MLKNLFKVSISACLILSLLSGCSKDSSVTPKKSEEKKPLTKVKILLDWTPNTNHTGLYAAKDNGYYSENGLDVEILKAADAGSPEIVNAGKAEFGVSYQEQVTFARTAKTPLNIKAIAAVIQHNTSGFASPAEKNIKTPKDFEGKVYGGWGSEVENSMIKALMAKSGADYGKLKPPVNIGSSDFFASTKKDVDFSWIYYGWDGISAELKNVKINFIKLIDQDPMLDYYTPVIITSESLIKNNPDLVKKFTAATKKGYEFAIANPSKAAEILTKNAPEIDKALALKSQEYLAKEYQSDSKTWGEMKLSVWENYSKWLFDNKLIPSNLDSKEAFTNDFIK